MSASALPSSPATERFSYRRHRVPVILQTERAECGLACLAMIASSFGFKTDIGQVRRRFQVSGHGTTLTQLMALAGKLQLSCRALKVEPRALHKLKLPCVLHWDMNHFVVLRKTGRRRITIHDPARGSRRLTWPEFSRHFTGIALELWPMNGFSEGSDIQRLRLSDFWHRGQGLAGALGQTLFLSVLLQIFALVTPLYMQLVVDEVVLREDLNLLAVLALGFGILLLIETGVSALRQLIVIHLASNLNMQMASRLFHHLARLPLDFFEKRHVGDVVSRFGSLDYIRQTITTSAVSAIVDGLLAMAALGAMYWYDPLLATLVLVSVVLYLGLRLLLFSPLKQASEEELVATAKKDTSFIESVRAIQTLKLFQKEDERQSQWQNHLADTINAEIRIARFGIGFDAANRLLLSGGTILVIYFAATSAINGALTLGMLFAFMSFRRHFVGSMTTFVEHCIEIRMLGLHLQRIADIAFTQRERYHRLEQTPAMSDSSRGRLEARNLTYRYSGEEKPVFENLSFIAEAGDLVAVSGPSGSGKTTLLKCLMGLLYPEQGEILLNGRNISGIENFRQQIGVVLQNDQLLSGSIAENICCFDATPDFDRILQCAEAACVHDDIIRLPMQYNTMIGDMNSGLSGGQVQRITIARALYRRSAILFLDEPTSQIDQRTEQIILDRLSSLDCTVFAISHRPGLYDHADVVIDISGLGDSYSSFTRSV